MERRKEDMIRFTLHSELTSLVEEVDKKVLIQLRDGRKVIGKLRSFDQFANIVLQDASERFYLEDKFGDLPLGLYLIKGDSVVLLGEIDEEKDLLLPGRLPLHLIADAHAQYTRARLLLHSDPLQDLDPDLF